MELKHYFAQVQDSPNRLLIVPYGIETSLTVSLFRLLLLLIVPYGIETQSDRLVLRFLLLLIVPYGIET